LDIAKMKVEAEGARGWLWDGSPYWPGPGPGVGWEVGWEVAARRDPYTGYPVHLRSVKIK
jgi:hypothetical protein